MHERSDATLDGKDHEEFCSRAHCVPWMLKDIRPAHFVPARVPCEGKAVQQLLIAELLTNQMLDERWETGFG